MSSILGEFGDKVISFISDTLKKPKKQQYADTVVRNEAGDILLLQRSYQDDFMAGKWCLAGGKIEDGEDRATAAKRELFEETGIDAEVTYLKTIVKDDCVISYFEAFADTIFILDNDEHYRYEFVPIANLGNYDLILDLHSVLKNEIIPLLSTPLVSDNYDNTITPEIAIADPERLWKHNDIVKAFDDGLIEDDHFAAYLKINQAVEEIKKGYDNEMVSVDKFFDALEKAKRFEFVKVVRDGKQFYQYRQVGSDKIEEDIETGDTVEGDGQLGLKVTKYSEKSILITGDTYKNLDLLRAAKEAAGYGTWNKSLNGWVFPLFAKDKVMAVLASKMDIATYDETVAQKAAIELKNSVDIGTPITVNGKETKVEEVDTNESGKVDYFSDLDGDNPQAEINRMILAAKGNKEIVDKLMQEFKRLDELPIGSISPDGKFIKTANGWEYVKKDQGVTEEEIGIPPVTDEKKVTELISNATEENRFKTGKQLMGKEEGEKPISDEIEKAGQKDIKIDTKEFETRSGEKVNALDHTNVTQTDIQLSDIDTILDKPKPYYIPDINEYMFGGSRDDKFIFDYVKMADGNFLVSLNGEKDGYTFNSDPRYKKVEPAYAVMSLDNLVATTEYYKTKRKAQLKREADEFNSTMVDRYKKLTPQQIEHYKPYSYQRLSAAQKKKISFSDWEALPVDEKLNWVEGMTSPVFAKKSIKRIKPLDDNTMLTSNFTMYKKYVDKGYKTPMDLGKRTYSPDDQCVIEYSEAREQIKWKRNDLEIQREENDSSYQKGRETSYGDSNTKDYLLDTHGIKVKSQNGKEISPEQVDQIKSNMDAIFESFGDRSSMARNFGLKVSHSGEKLMHASKALGFYIPSMKAIGVSDNKEHGKFGFTLAHEMAHFLDNYLGKKVGKHYASDDFNSTAGKIANEFRKNMNVSTDSNYLNRTCECLARSFEQYHAMKSAGEDAIKSKAIGVPYHQMPEHVSKEKFNTVIKPLIEQFFQENDDLLKSAFDELSLIDINNSFELIKSAFDNNEIEADTFLQYTQKFNDLTKGDPSHGGKLIKKIGVDKMGKKTTKWVSRDQASDDDKKGNSQSNNQSGKQGTSAVAHSPEVLNAFAKETPMAELKRVINESSDEKLRQAAHAEIDRREKEEKPEKEKEDVKKKDKSTVTKKSEDSKALLAPNGKKSKLNEKQYNLVRTPEFKSWFGDWENDPENASKVVDENGEPLVVYHGSKNDFDEFDKSSIASNSGNEGHYGKGFYFSDDVREAKGYGDNVKEVFLNIKKPFEQNDDNFDLLKKNGVDSVEDKEDLGIDYESLLDEVNKVDKVAGKLMEAMKKNGYEEGWREFLKKNKVSDAKIDLNDVSDLFRYSEENDGVPDKESFSDLGINFDNLKVRKGYKNEQSLHWVTDLGKNADSVTKVMKELGFDGTMVGSEYVAFESNQIKSATNNSGKFDEKSSKINE